MRTASPDGRLAGFVNDLIALRGEVSLLKWMVGFNLAMALAILWRALRSRGLV